MPKEKNLSVMELKAFERILLYNDFLAKENAQLKQEVASLRSMSASNEPDLDETFFDLVKASQEAQEELKAKDCDSQDCDYNMFKRHLGEVSNVVSTQLQSSPEVAPCPPAVISPILGSQTNSGQPLGMRFRRNLNFNKKERATPSRSHSPPDMLITSYDRLPRVETGSPPYPYQNSPVRKKAARRKLKGFACSCCKGGYKAMCNADNTMDTQVQELVQRCSRHRSKYAPRPTTPPFLFDPTFPPTQEIEERRRLQDLRDRLEEVECDL